MYLSNRFECRVFNTERLLNKRSWFNASELVKNDKVNNEHLRVLADIIKTESL